MKKIQEENTQKVPAKGKETKKEAKKQPPKKTGKDAVQASIEIPDIEAPDHFKFFIDLKIIKYAENMGTANIYDNREII